MTTDLTAHCSPVGLVSVIMQLYVYEKVTRMNDETFLQLKALRPDEKNQLFWVYPIVVLKS